MQAYVATFPPDAMVRMLTHSTATVRLFIEQAMAQFTALELSPRRRELVILAVAAEVDGEFVAAQHGPIAAREGVTEAERELLARRDFAGLAGPDRVLVEFTAAVLAGPRVPDELFAAVREFLSEREIVEVLQVCGYYWTFSRIATVLDVPVTEVYGL
ncbi:carboxymuconolactone decarboxylase family protein [Amycolatopsis rhabdoformis]|uniref:Carboxymuconolactone decarboxylase family protein n=1 Tax=Amycolatopsis rhabdoformis TaxID=1448059 RepID=A0ABZ1I339_9PSEU|nr:carboxymuconolactone decarboxylase family protein [Amycolatopsis rhabdoformis]WSE28807.1 carboxymuconolactone decarboxylase family protein [Amycolatopsis rhabdoformis]